jgi:hypothetical protein
VLVASSSVKKINDMNQKTLSWTIAVGLVGVLLASKETYWYPGTYLSDLSSLGVGLVGGAMLGFLFGLIVKKTTDEREARAKIFNWLLAMTGFGLFLSTGKGVPIKTTLTVMSCTISIGLAAGVLQFWLTKGQRTHADGQGSGRRTADSSYLQTPD